MCAVGSPGLSRPPRHAHLSVSTGGARSHFSYSEFIPLRRQLSLTTSARRPKARKSLGQHFLADSRVVSRIIAAAGLSCQDTVVEIGPGRGVLTRRLAQEAGRVVAVELDATLCEELPQRLGFPANLECIEADAREADLALLLASSSGGMPGEYKVIGNLPYYAANPIVRRLLESSFPPSMALVMVQKEVAESMTASPGEMSLLSVATQCYAKARMLFTVPPSSFRPAPKVRSAVVRLDVMPEPVVPHADRDAFFQIARAGFSAPRKQLHNSLSHGLEVEPATSLEILDLAGVDAKRRPATLALGEWVAVLASWREVCRNGKGHAD